MKTGGTCIGHWPANPRLRRGLMMTNDNRMTRFWQTPISPLYILFFILFIVRLVIKNRNIIIVICPDILWYFLNTFFWWQNRGDFEPFLCHYDRDFCHCFFFEGGACVPIFAIICNLRIFSVSTKYFWWNNALFSEPNEIKKHTTDNSWYVGMRNKSMCLPSPTNPNGCKGKTAPQGTKKSNQQG